MLEKRLHFLTGNQITSLPDSIGDLDALEYLQVSYSGIESIPTGINKKGVQIA